ncbi:MAG: hypothetical protein NVS2B14_21310 [Chamaesiphon sp.]
MTNCDDIALAEQSKEMLAVLRVAFTLATEQLAEYSDHSAFQWRVDLTKQAQELFDRLSAEELEEFLRDKYQTSPQITQE